MLTPVWSRLAGSVAASTGLIGSAMAAGGPVTANTINRQWILKSRPTGAITMDNYEYREKPLGTINLKEGEILVRHTIFGMAPARDQFFNDFLDAGYSVLAVGEKTKADFRVAAINDEEVSPKNVTNNEQAMKALTNGTPDQMRDAVAKAQKPYDKSNEEAAKLQSKNRGCD